MKNETIDMTEGIAWKQILAFAGPIFFGSLFQQFYHTADSMIVGNFLGSSALAAVSSSSNLLNMLIGFFNGVAMGAGIVIARYFGAKDYEGMKRAIHTNVAFGFLFGIFLSILGVILAPWMLEKMGTPREMFPLSVLYFRVYFAGMLTVAMYNTFTGILRAIGDSRYPIYYLVIASIINIILDLLFVGIFRLGVGSAAFATVVSQAVSSILCFRRLTRLDEAYRLVPSQIRIEGQMLREIISYGLPSGIQVSITSFANVIMQSNINQFGVAAVAGCGAYEKIDGFTFLPITSFSMSLSTFVGQNLGAKRYDRVKQGIRFGIPCGIILAECMGVMIFICSPWLIGLFDRSPEVIAYGMQKARTQAPFFYALAATHCMAGVLRGAGRTKITMATFLTAWCVIRVAVVTVAMSFLHSIQVVNWVYPLTWNISMVIFILYMWRTDWMDVRLRERRPLGWLSDALGHMNPFSAE